MRYHLHHSIAIDWIFLDIWFRELSVPTQWTVLTSHLKSGKVFDILIIWFSSPTVAIIEWTCPPFDSSICALPLIFPYKTNNQCFSNLYCKFSFSSHLSAVSITLGWWCANSSLLFTMGNPLYVAFSRSFSVGRIVNFPKFQFILSPGPLGHPPITPLCSSNWAGQDAPLAGDPPCLHFRPKGDPVASESHFFGRMGNLFVGGDIRYGDITWNVAAWISSC